MKDRDYWMRQALLFEDQNKFMMDEIKRLRAIIQRKDEALRFRSRTQIGWKK